MKAGARSRSAAVFTLFRSMDVFSMFAKGCGTGALLATAASLCSVIHHVG